MRRALVLAWLVAASAAAATNAQHPGPSITVSIDFREGHDQDVVAGLSFGLVISHDGGATWRWMCETALHYGFPVLPQYAYARSGRLFCASHDGLFVDRDGCTFAPTEHGDRFVSALTIGPDDTLYAAAAALDDANIYRSTDDGVTFAAGASPGQGGDWWNSIAVAPSAPGRVYLTGYRVGTPRTFLLFRSDDAGATFQPMERTGITTSNDSEIWIAGIDGEDPDTLYVRVSRQVLGVVSDAIYRSTDGGATWTNIYAVPDDVAFVRRASGELVVAGRNSGLHRSADRGDTWSDVPALPSITCLVESAAGEVWACTNNVGIEDAAIMKSTDLETWTRVLRYADIAGPVDCPADTVQHDVCAADPNEWCVIRAMFGIAGNPTGCVSEVPQPDLTTVDAPCDGCCCRAGGGRPGGGVVMLAGVLVSVTVRRRRRIVRA